MIGGRAEFAVPIPDALSSENAGPLMCAGATVFTPMAEYGVTPWMRTAVAIDHTRSGKARYRTMLVA